MKKLTHPDIHAAFATLAAEQVAAFEALPPAPFCPSAAFEEKIQRLIRAQERWTWNFVKTPKRKLATIIAIIATLLALLMSISCVREAGFYFVTKAIPGGFTDFIIKGAGVTNSNDVITEYLSPQWLPEGYTEVEHRTSTVYQSYVWKSETGRISFYQHHAESISFSINTENALFEEVYISNRLFYVNQRYGKYGINWIDGQYIFMLTCPTSLEWETIVRMIESIS